MEENDQIESSQNKLRTKKPLGLLTIVFSIAFIVFELGMISYWIYLANTKLNFCYEFGCFGLGLIMMVLIFVSVVFALIAIKRKGSHIVLIILLLINIVWIFFAGEIIRLTKIFF